MIWIALMVIMWVMGMAAGWLARRNPPSVKSRNVASVKILTPPDNPWGTTAELIAWAERRAVDEHRAAYSDPVTEELQKRFLAEFHKGRVAVLEDHDFRTPNEVRAEAGYIRMSNGQYGRYLDNIGYIAADSPELPNRACHVVLEREASKGLLLKLMGHYHSVGPEVRAKSMWVMGEDWFARVRNVADHSGRPLWTPSFSTGGIDYLMGLPITIADPGCEPHLELEGMQ